jgi:hypothetical protein
MNSLAIGIIEEIMEDLDTTAEAKVAEIARTLQGMNQAWDAKKASVRAESNEESIPVNYTIDRRN